MNLFHRWLCRSDYWRKFLRESMLPWALANADLGQHLLEVGAGPGLTTDALRSLTQHVTAVEIDSGLATSLALRLSHTNVTTVRGDATQMPFPDRSFDSAVSFTMLHHVPSPVLQDKLLREVRRVLKPGASFLGTDSVDSWLLRLIHVGDTLVPVNPETFSDRLEAAGFQDVSIESKFDAFRFRARRPKDWRDWRTSP